MRVSVIGGGVVDQGTYDVAEHVGRLLGTRGHDVICGGLSGVMEAVGKGMAETGGQTIGILPGNDPKAANSYIDVPIATGIGSARNVFVVKNGAAAIAIDGATGTLSEIAHALDMGKPIAGLDTHDIEGVESVTTPEAAVEYVETAVE
ncbi:TIGR00725 family protein [Halodesulfurarchaeum sp.]|uniref:TIGR00725 family protein n=1 Tax=Halodesulfurarchaeum sp. TaxID=1980530 RepID=UPI001BC1D0AE|nr:TIGR00725 family protein [Halodesulfurarchaeum sp.]